MELYTNVHLVKHIHNSIIAHSHTLQKKKKERKDERNKESAGVKVTPFSFDWW